MVKSQLELQRNRWHSNVTQRCSSELTTNLCLNFSQSNFRAVSHQLPSIQSTSKPISFGREDVHSWYCNAKDDTCISRLLLPKRFSWKLVNFALCTDLTRSNRFSTSVNLLMPGVVRMRRFNAKGSSRTYLGAYVGLDVFICCLPRPSNP